MSYVPYSDDIMEYDINKHQYVLTYNGVLQGLGIDLYQYNIDSENIDFFLKRTSAQIYNYIKIHVRNSSWLWVEYVMAMDSDLRDVIYEALLGQVEYFVASGGSLVALQHGVSLEKDRFVPLSELRGARKIADSTEMILLNNGLLYTGDYPMFDMEKYRVGY